MFITAIFGIYIELHSDGLRRYEQVITDHLGNQYTETLLTFEFPDGVFKNVVRRIIREDSYEDSYEIRTTTSTSGTVWRYRAGQIQLSFFDNVLISDAESLVLRFTDYELKLIRLSVFEFPCGTRSIMASYSFNEALINFDDLSKLILKENIVWGTSLVRLSQPQRPERVHTEPRSSIYYDPYFNERTIEQFRNQFVFREHAAGVAVISIQNNTKQTSVGVIDQDSYCRHVILRSRVRSHNCARSPCDIISTDYKTWNTHGTRVSSLILTTAQNVQM
jgi:hypothetical protein